MYLPEDIEDSTKKAVLGFWRTRDFQKSKQEEKGIHDTGERSATTGGKQLDGFIELFKRALLINGVPDSFI